MAKGKTTWRYNKLLTARRNYFEDGGMPNTVQGPEMPQAFSNIQAGDIVGPPGTAGKLGSNVISGQGGNTSGMGMMGSIGSIGMQAAQDIGNMINNINSIDIKEDADRRAKGITSRQMGITYADSFDTLANDFSTFGQLAHIDRKDLGYKNFGQGFGDAFAAGNKGFAAGSGMGPWGAAAAATGSTITSIIGNVFRNKAIQKETDRLNSLIDYTNRYNERALANRASNLVMGQLSGLEANYAAFGGPMDLGGSAIDYDYMNRYLMAKELSAINRNSSLGSLPNTFAEGGGIHIKEANRGKFTKYCGGNVTSECIARGKRSSSPAVRKRATFAANARKWKHAFGGDLLTHGANFDTGVTIIGNGGSHEENPYEGVPVGVDNEGVPNLVEEGEVIFNDYVFSNRLKVPKDAMKKLGLRGTRSITFAEAAIQISKESEERPNDPISRAGLESNMNKLMVIQESLREKNNKGRKFARGGKMGRLFAGLITDPDPNRLRKGFRGFSIIPFEGPDPVYVTGPGYNSGYIPELSNTGNLVNPDLPNAQVPPPVSTDIPGTAKDPDEPGIFSPASLRLLPAFMAGSTAVTDALGITNKPDYTEANMISDAARIAGTYKPIRAGHLGNYMEYNPFDREYYITGLKAQSGASRRAILQNAGMNRGAGLAALLALDYNTQNQYGQLARQAEEYNLAQRQKSEEFNRATNMFNTEMDLKADTASQEAMLKANDAYLKGTMAATELMQNEKQQSVTARSANLSNFAESFGDIGREEFARNMIVSDPSKYYTIDHNGNITYKKPFYDLSEDQQTYIEGHANRKMSKKKSKGGYLTRKKTR